MSLLKIVPLDLAEANALVEQMHRHHGKTVGHKFSLGVAEGERICGAAIVGRPVSRHLDDGWTLEVLRLVTDGTKNACSMLYAGSWRVARSLGYRKCITYVLATETGDSVRAAGWKMVGQTAGGSWNVPSRPRVDKHPTIPKFKFEVERMKRKRVLRTQTLADGRQVTHTENCACNTGDVVPPKPCNCGALDPVCAHNEKRGHHYGEPMSVGFRERPWCKGPA